MNSFFFLNVYVCAINKLNISHVHINILWLNFNLLNSPTTSESILFGITTPNKFWIFTSVLGIPYYTICFSGHGDNLKYIHPHNTGRKQILLIFKLLWIPINILNSALDLNVHGYHYLTHNRQCNFYAEVSLSFRFLELTVDKLWLQWLIFSIFVVWPKH